MKTQNWLVDLRLLFVNLFRRVLLDRFQYCHVRNARTGTTVLREGPGRIWLGFFGELVCEVKDKIVVNDGQFVVVHNPYDQRIGDICEGERDVRVGAQTFSLYPGERLDDKGVQNVFVLTDREALLVRAQKEAPHPWLPSKSIPAGTEVLVRGFCRYIPHKDVEIVEKRTSISLSEEDGVYVQNDDTGLVRLVAATELFLEQNESLWDKVLTQDEMEALGYAPQKVSRDTRTLAVAPRSRNQLSDAVVVDLENNQVICLQGKSREKQRVVFGPDKIFLEPHERPRILTLSGGVPVRPNALKVAVLDLGPDFIMDEVKNVRTSDNACLSLAVNYHWRMKVDEQKPEKLFALKDLIGFAAEVLSAKIREVVAQHTFEDFHAKAAQLVKEAVLGEEGVYFFPENGFEVFEIVIDKIVPEDPEIQKKLTDGIKATVDVFTNRVREEAKLASEHRLIEGQLKNEEARHALLEKVVANTRYKELEEAKTRRQALLETVQGEAEALRVKAEAERQAEELRLRVLTNALAGEGGERYLALEQARVLRDTDKVVVPSDARLRLDLSGIGTK